MTQALHADFFGGGAPLAAPRVSAPKKTAATIEREKKQAALRERSKQDALDLQRKIGNNKLALQKAKDAKWQRDEDARLQADPGPDGQRYRAQMKRIHSAGVDWGLIPLGATVIGTGAAVIATGGAVAGALGATAAVSTAAAATTASQAINTATKAAKAAGAIQKGDVKAVAGAAAKQGGDMFKIQTDFKVPKVNLAKQAQAAVKPLASAAKALPKSAVAAAVKQTTAALPKPAVTAGKTLAQQLAGKANASALLPFGRSTGTPLAAQMKPRDTIGPLLVKQKSTLKVVKPATAPKPTSALALKPASPTTPKASATAPKAVAAKTPAKAATTGKTSVWLIPREGPDKGRIILSAV